MDTSHPSRPEGRQASAKAGARRAAQAYWVSFSLRDEAVPLVRMDGGESVLTEGGRKVAECWRALGEGRPFLEPDAVSIGPRTVQGILRLMPGHLQAQELIAAARLFKALSARALAGDRPARASAAGIWKKGFAERPLDTLKQVVDARAALKALEARAMTKAKAKPKR